MHRTLSDAFDATLRSIERAIANGARTRGGESARAELERLRVEVVTARQAAMDHGTVDREWVARAVREVAAWAPDDEIDLIAALGRIARAAATTTTTPPR